MEKKNLFRRIIDALCSFFGKKCNCDECLEKNGENGIFCYKDEGRTKEMLNYSEIITALKSYDTSRIAPFEKAFGYEDSRVNTFDFVQFKKYLGHVENLSKKANIKMTGISFISVAKMHENENKEYGSLIYIPSTTVNGMQVLYDPVQSVRQGTLVTFKEMLEKHGYNWIYDSKEAYKKGKRDDYDYGLKSDQKSRMMVMSTILNDTLEGDEESGAGNWSTMKPPY